MKLNPEHNVRLRALLYVIGCGGLVHLTTLLILAITKHDAAYFHPLYTIDVDQLWPGSRHNRFIYVSGWLLFAATIYGVYRWLSRRQNRT